MKAAWELLKQSVRSGAVQPVNPVGGAAVIFQSWETGRRMNHQDSFSAPLKPESIAKLVVERIEKALLKKELSPGDMLPSETELVQSLGVGKSSIREAIKMLEALGILEIRRGEGTFITNTIPSAALNPLILSLAMEQTGNEHIRHLRIMYESAYVIMAMETADEQDTKVMEKALSNFENALDKGSVKEETILSFHRALLRATHNPFVIRIGDAVLTLFSASFRRSASQRQDKALQSQKVLFSAFREREKERALQAVRDCISHE